MTSEAFFRPVLRALSPLLVWAAHFALCYAIAALACSRSALVLVSAAALAACLALLWRERDLLGSAGDDIGLRRWCAAGGAVLALAGIAWTSVPVLVLHGCA